MNVRRLVWLFSAVGFEFGFGPFVDGLSWSRLLSDYDLSRGRLVVLIWAAVGASPFMLARLNQRQAPERNDLFRTPLPLPEGL